MYQVIQQPLLEIWIDTNTIYANIFEHKCLKLGDLTQCLMHNSMLFSCDRLSSVFIF